MKKSLAKLTFISTLMLAANNALALPNDNNDKDEEVQIAEEAMLIQVIDPVTGLIIYARCPTLPDCDDDYQSMAELDQDE